MHVPLQEEERQVSRKDGINFARKHGALLVETSAKGNIAVDQAFEELVLKILETPTLLAGTSSNFGLKPKAAQQQRASSCC